MKVSIVIPTYNNEGTISAVVKSALAQNVDGPFEVIVVNDGSTDGTRAQLAVFGNRIRVIDQENKGLSAARNAGIAAASGTYIALLDGDDTWLPDKLAKTVPVLEKDPACVAVFSDAIQVDGKGNVVVPYFVASHQAHSPTLDEMLAQSWMILPSTMVMRKASMLATGGFPEQFGRRGYGGEDTFAFLLLRELGEIHFVAEKLVRYRLSDFSENFEKRIRARDRSGSERSSSDDPELMLEGYLIFARLVRDRFGVRGHMLARSAIDTVGLGLVSLGLMAMHKGDRELARRCYLASLRYRPLDAKTYVRLGWASLPARIGAIFTAMLTPRIRRGLTGPPFHILYDRR